MKLSHFWSAANATVAAKSNHGCCPRLGACPLSRVRAGMQVRIKEFSTPNDVTTRLREIGFCEQQVIKLLFQQTSVICLVCNARVAISSELAQLIMVEPAA